MLSKVHIARHTANCPLTSHVFCQTFMSFVGCSKGELHSRYWAHLSAPQIMVDPGLLLGVSVSGTMVLETSGNMAGI